MIWFQRLFPVVMLAWPVVATAVLLPRAGGIGRELARPARMRTLWLATLVLVLGHVGVQAWLEWTRPLGSQLRAVYPILMAVFGSSALWFGFAVRVLPEARHEGHQDRVEGAVRSASLVARHRSRPVRPAVWAAGWIVFAVCVAAMLWAIRQGASAGLAAGTALWLFAGPLAARLSLGEPEPLDARGSRELIEAYDRLRRFKTRAFFGMGLAGTAGFAALAVAVALRPELGGILGGILGLVLGLGGCALGLIGGARRAHIVRLRHRLAVSAPGTRP